MSEVLDWMRQARRWLPKGSHRDAFRPEVAALAAARGDIAPLWETDDGVRAVSEAEALATRAVSTVGYWWGSDDEVLELRRVAFRDGDVEMVEVVTEMFGDGDDWLPTEVGS